ncbi:MAG: hypothetical protein GY757_08420, partial [bacterium]|nr:hypothetical protein [bacterium]
ENSGFLGTIVRETGSDGGFLLNSDASRVLVVDETGTPLSEELTLPLFSKMVLDSGEKSDIVTNYSTSKIIDSIAAQHNVRVFRTDVGQPYVVQMIRDNKVAIGGEGSGSVVYSPFSYGFDAFIFIKKMVAYLRKNKTTISEIARQFEPPDIHKETLFLPPNKIYTFLEKIGELYQDKKKLIDGFYIETADYWLCIRASATVSMIRLVGEGGGVREQILRLKEIVE